MILLLTKEQYIKEVEQRYITRRVHPEYKNIVILNYTENAVFEQRWNHVTLNCRGLIIDENTGEVLARPFPKFFNYGEYAEYEKDIPFHEIPEFTVKQDGSLGISYKIHGKTYWSTRGSFESAQAEIANYIWNKKYSHVVIPDEITLLVEIIDPKTKVVVDYDGLSDLIIIGAIHRFTGHDYNYQELVQLGENLRMQVTERKTLTLDEVIQLKETIGYNQEGWVLRWSNGKRLKIKGNQYLDIHRIAYGLSNKMKVGYWKDGKIEELILKMPEEFRTEIEQFTSTLENKLEFLKQKLLEEVTRAKSNSNDRKTFAMYVNENAPKSIRHLIFKSYDERLEPQVLKEHIYKNYLDFL